MPATLTAPDLSLDLRLRHRLGKDADVAIRTIGGAIDTSADGREFTCIANTAAVDLDNEVVIPEGADTSYLKRFGSILFNHNSSLPVGSIRTVTNSGGKWAVVAAFASTAFASDVRTLVKEGCIKGVSIGFCRTSAGTPTKEEIATYGDCNYITREWTWLELSVTPIPCNPDAMILAAKAIKSGRIAPVWDEILEREQSRRLESKRPRRIIFG